MATNGGNTSGWSPVLGFKTVTGKYEIGSLNDTGYINYYHDTRTTNGVDFQLTLPKKTGTLAVTADNVASATKLQTTRYIWGQAFDGTGSVSGNMTGVGSITASGTIKSTGTQGFLNETATGVWAYMRLKSNANLWDVAVKDTDLSGALQIRYAGLDANRVVIATDGHVGIGKASPSYPLDVAGSIAADSWIRTRNDTGWYNNTYQGGIYMCDPDWIRTYNSKPLLVQVGENNTRGIGGHRLSALFAGGSHASILLAVQGGTVAYGICANANGNMYFGKRTNGSYYDTTGDTYLMMLNSTGLRIGDSTAPSYRLDVNGSAIVRGWLRTTGSQGWYSETYGGGWYMSDTTWIRGYNAKSLYMGSGIIRTDYYFDRQGYGGTSWGQGYGAYNVAITDSTAQTPLMVAYRAGQSPAVTGANRLFSAELLNSGTVLNLWFGGKARQTLYSDGSFRLSSVGTHGVADGGGGDVYAELWRGAYASWKILNTGGTLKFQSNYTDKVGDYFDCLTVAYNTGDVAISGNIGLSQTAGTGRGISLYGGTANVATFGIMFALTSNFGKCGAVQGDWATYLTMEGSVNRGWVFRHKTNGNVASVSANGTIYAKTGIYSDGYVSARGQNTSSDARLKRNLHPFEIKLHQIANAPSVSFDWKEGSHDVGSIAQYWQGVNPSLTPKGPDGYLTLQYGKTALLGLIPVAKKVMRLDNLLISVGKRVRSHEERIAELEKENKELKRKIENLERR